MTSAVRMAPSPDAGWAAIFTTIGVAITGLFAWLVQKSKGGTDVEVAVLGEWQKLYNALSLRVAALEKQIADMQVGHAAELKEARDYAAGLERQIAQNSQSTAHLLSASPVTRPKEAGDEG